MKKILVLVSFIFMMVTLISCGNINNKNDEDDGINGKTQLQLAFKADTVEVPFYYNDNFFVDSSYKFNLKRFKAAYMLTISTCKDETSENSDNYLKSYYNQCKFENIYTSEYYQKEDDFNSLCYGFASKNININDVDYTLISIAIRGINYNREWYNNFIIGEEGPHQGFNEGKVKVLDDLMNFIENNNLTNNNLKFWLTGYSRGAAIANLVSNSLNQYAYYKNNNEYYNNSTIDYNYRFDLNIKNEDIYADLFSTASCDEKENVSNFEDLNRNIFNGINPNDIVPLIPFFKYHGRYVDVTHNVNMSDYKKELEKIGLNKKNDFKNYNSNVTLTQNEYINSIFYPDIMKAGMTDRKAYVDNYQEYIAFIFSEIRGMKTYQYNNVINYVKKNYDVTSIFTNYISGQEIDTDKEVDRLIETLKAGMNTYHVTVSDEEKFNESLNVFSSYMKVLINNDKSSNYVNLITFVANIDCIIYAHAQDYFYAYIVLYGGK